MDDSGETRQEPVKADRGERAIADRRFVVWDADGRPLEAFADFDTAHQWAHGRMRQAHTRLPLTVDDRVAKVSRRLSHARCELVAWAEFAVLPGCDLPSLHTPSAAAPDSTPAHERHDHRHPCSQPYVGRNPRGSV